MFQRITGNLPIFLTGLCEIAVGILLLVNPVRFTSGILIALGVLLVLCGAYDAAMYFITDPIQAAKEQKLTRGLTLLIIGLFCILRSGWFIATFPALTMIYGVLLLLIGLAKVQHTVDMLRLKKAMWPVAAISAAVSLITAALILFNPFESTRVLWVLMSISLIAQAAADLLSLFLKKLPAAKPSAVFPVSEEKKT